METFKKIIQINGAKRSGKDTTADFIVDSIESSEKFSFSTPMKDIVSTTFGISMEDMELHKNNPDDFKIEIKDKDNKVIQSTDFRKVLQENSQSVKKHFGDTVWKDLLLKEVEKSDADLIVVADYRFPEEKIDGATTVFIRNDDIESNDSHCSENALKDEKFDFILDNTGYCLKKEDALNIIKKIKDKV